MEILLRTFVRAGNNRGEAEAPQLRRQNVRCVSIASSFLAYLPHIVTPTPYVRAGTYVNFVLDHTHVSNDCLCIHPLVCENSVVRALNGRRATEPHTGTGILIPHPFDSIAVCC